MSRPITCLAFRHELVDVLATVRSILKALRPAACRCASSACMPAGPVLVMGRASTPLAIWHCWNASKTNSIRPSAAARWTIDHQMSQREQSIHTPLRDTRRRQ